MWGDHLESVTLHSPIPTLNAVGRISLPRQDGSAPTLGHGTPRCSSLGAQDAARQGRRRCRA